MNRAGSTSAPSTSERHRQEVLEALKKHDLGVLEYMVEPAATECRNSLLTSQPVGRIAT